MYHSTVGIWLLDSVSGICSILAKINLLMIQFSLRERDTIKYLNTIASFLNTGASKKDFCL